MNTILVVVLVGCLRSRTCDPLFQKSYYNKVLGEAPKGLFLARVYEPPSEKEKSVKVLLDLCGFRSGTAEFRVTGKVMAYLEKTEASLGLAYGDMLAFEASIEEVPLPKNPGEFDYRTYLRHLGVTGRIYLRQKRKEVSRLFP